MLAPFDERSSWPPDYTSEFMSRDQALTAMRKDPKFAIGAKVYYSTRPVEFILHWCITYDPRNAGTRLPTSMPFVLFKRQVELVEFLHACLSSEQNGLVEKCRDLGATWVCSAFSVWMWLFMPGVAVGWGSRKEQLVDRIGDPDSIFEKMRMIVTKLPEEFQPAGLSPKDHMTYMRFVNPENMSTITGESGDNIGRGGRKRIYFKDESAHYEHPESIEAALGDNTRVQIDVSSVNGIGNVFHRKRDAGIEWTPGVVPGRDTPPGKTAVFIMQWNDHPAKTPEWYQLRHNKAIDDGLLHVFRQEVDRDYAASVEGVICPAEWVKSSIDAHVKLGINTGTGWYAGLDVADEGGDLNALVVRRGILLNYADDWGLPDTGQTTRRAISTLVELVPKNSKGRHPVRVMYDSVGVGSGVKAETNRLTSDEVSADERMPAGIKFYSWNAGAKVVDPEGQVEESDDGEAPTNEDFFGNLKAQAWWALRRRFEKTHRCVEAGKVLFPVEELISIPSSLPKLRSLQKELSQPVRKKNIVSTKLIVDKKPPGTRSPNMADGVVQCYFPVESGSYDASLDWL